MSPVRSARRAGAVIGACVVLAAFACGDESSSDDLGVGPHPGGDGGRPNADGGSSDGGGIFEPDFDGSSPDGGTTPEPDAGGPRKTDPQPFPVSEGFYPRVIQRSNGAILASVIRFLPDSQRMGATFFESTDDGVTFKQVGVLDDPMNKRGLCCGTLYELPRAIGALTAGTLLYAASNGGDTKNEPMTIPIWQSTDGGRTWAYLSKAGTGAVNRAGGGLWEPELVLLDDGNLVCHYSDETDGVHSQRLVATRSSDGVNWSAPKNVVSFDDHALRPGMPVVRRPPGQDYTLSYEICSLSSGPCTAFTRTSKDGWNWGDTNALGARASTIDGKHFRHAPTLAWNAKPGDSGRFYMVGQLVFDGSGKTTPESGTILLANTQRGFGYWFPIAAPIPVPDAFDNFCPNYSSSLLPLDDGNVVLEVASRWDGKACRTYYARAPLTNVSDGSEIADGKTYRLASVISGLCLDVDQSSTQAGANVQQFTCNGTNAQAWTVVRATSGTIALRAGTGNMCLAVAGNSGAPGANVEQQPCDGGPAQSWNLRGVGVGHYELKHTGGTTCLDVAAASTSPGSNVATWTCNDLAPQIWKFTGP